MQAAPEICQDKLQKENLITLLRDTLFSAALFAFWCAAKEKTQQELNGEILKTISRNVLKKGRKCDKIDYIYKALRTLGSKSRRGYSGLTEQNGAGLPAEKKTHAEGTTACASQSGFRESLQTTISHCSSKRARFMPFWVKTVRAKALL